ncbi:hypothetical protein [Aeromonas caviae]|uniref:hypothetical protein n=1 Tax=Aeromonas caviae TaxID=648 RepID=UPI000DA345BD|nr:hypothetical protein [Aeromonas caviae]SQH59616.1 Uncharacterised protein [Aeromonas caviae]
MWIFPLPRHPCSTSFQGGPLRISDNEQLHLAVFDDGSFELIRGDIFQYHDKYEIPVPDQPKYGSDESFWTISLLTSAPHQP